MKTAKQILQEFGDDSVDLIRENIRKSGKNATGKTYRSLKSKATDNRLIVDGARHIYVLEEGRRPGKMPPVDRLIEWATVRGFENPKSAGYAISKKIAEKGTKLFQQGGRTDIITPALEPSRFDKLITKLRDVAFAKVSKIVKSFTGKAIMFAFFFTRII